MILCAPWKPLKSLTSAFWPSTRHARWKSNSLTSSIPFRLTPFTESIVILLCNMWLSCSFYRIESRSLRIWNASFGCILFFPCSSIIVLSVLPLTLSRMKQSWSFSLKISTIHGVPFKCCNYWRIFFSWRKALIALAATFFLLILTNSNFLLLNLWQTILRSHDWSE